MNKEPLITVEKVEETVTKSVTTLKYKVQGQYFDKKSDAVAYAVRNSKVKAFYAFQQQCRQTTYWDEADFIFIPDEQEVALVHELMSGIEPSELSHPGWFIKYQNPEEGWPCWTELTQERFLVLKNPSYIVCDPDIIETFQNLPDDFLNKQE